MKNLKRVLSLALSTVMLMGMMVVGTSAASFKDVDTADNLTAIEVLNMLGVMKGNPDGTFDPDKNVTRNEMAVVLCNLLGLTPGGVCPFTDVPSWAQPYVAACYANGIVSGYSATEFGGEDSITAAQASLMVSKTLGYFEYQGEFEDDWKLATIKRANKINLFRDLSVTVDQKLTRNDIAQLVTNALHCTVVVPQQEGGLNVEGNGMSVSVKPTYRYTARPNQTGVDYSVGAVDYWNDFWESDSNWNTDDETMQLVEKLYGDDVAFTAAGVTDGMGRPADEWKYGDKTVVAPHNPTKTYVGSVKNNVIYKDLNRTSAIAANKITLRVDGVDVAWAAGDLTNWVGYPLTADQNAKVAADGQKTEVYYYPVDGTVTIVKINDYASKVVTVTNSQNVEGKYDITVATGFAGQTDFTFESDVKYNVGDIVTFTYSAKNNAIASMGATTAVEGKVTEAKKNEYVVIDGKTYNYNKNIFPAADKLSEKVVDNNVLLHLDANGFIAKVGEATVTTNYAVVLGADDGGWTYGSKDYKAQMLFADGTVKVVALDDTDADKNGEADSYTKIKGALAADKVVLVSYTTNGKDVYKISSIQDGGFKDTTGSLEIVNNRAQVELDGNTYFANAKTQFYFTDSASGAKQHYSWTGVKNVIGFDNDDTLDYDYYYFADGQMLEAVYIVSDKNISSSNKDFATFIYSNGNEAVIKNTEVGDYYKLKAVVDGEITTVNVSAAEYDAKFAGNGLQGLSSIITEKYKVNTDGIITNVIDGTIGGLVKGDGYLFVNNIKAISNDVIELDGVKYTYNSDAMVFEFDNDSTNNYGDFVKRSIDSLIDGGSYKAWVQIEDLRVVAAYYVD